MLLKLDEDHKAAQQRAIDLEQAKDKNEKFSFDLRKEAADVEQRVQEMYWLLHHESQRERECSAS